MTLIKQTTMSHDTRQQSPPNSGPGHLVNNHAIPTPLTIQESDHDPDQADHEA
jgi:hypothetical protein